MQRSLMIILSTKTITMQCFNKSMSLLFFLGFCSPRSIIAQPSSVPVVPPPKFNPNFWIISTMQRVESSSNTSIGQGDTTFLPVLHNSGFSYGTYFGFYTMDSHSFILVIALSGPQGPIVWSANPDNPVSPGAILTFTGEGDLLLQDGGTLIWSTATNNRSVAGMRLDLSGNLVLFYQNNSLVWQSFDHPTDTLVMGQSLCSGTKLRAKLSSQKWSSSRFYLSAELNGLRHYFEPAAYTQLFQSTATSTPTKSSACYAFANGSLGFPDKIFSLPSASSLQFMRLESDGHLRLYEMQEQNSPRMLLDVLSTVVAFCDYPLACGDYGVCNSGQCSCPSFNTFRFQNERLPGSGCIP